jgi:hypothetical protein
VPERSATQDKLQEANFFRHQLRDKAGSQDEFRWTLTAFIVAARGAVEIMGKEYAHRPGFRDWFRMKEHEMFIDPVISFIHRKRNHIVHTRVLKVYGRHRSDLDDLLGTDLVDLAARAKDGSYAWTFRHFPKRDVMGVVEEVLTKLERLVQECMQQFGDPAVWRRESRRSSR